MKKKILSFVLATMLVSTTGMPIMAHAEELPTAKEETVTEVPATETPVTETPAAETPAAEEITTETPAVETTETDKVEVETDKEPIAAENEVETASDEDTVAADIEEEASEEDELDSEEELEEEEEEHEHDIIYVPAGNHQHKIMCATADENCDFEETIEDCVDEDKDGYCDLCNESVEHKGSSLKIKVVAREYSYYDAEGNLEVSDDYYSYYENTISSENELLLDECIKPFFEKTAAPEKTEDMSEEEYEMNLLMVESDNDTKDIICSTIKDLDLPEICPEDLEITITLNDLGDGVANVETNYVPEDKEKDSETEDPESEEELTDEEIAAKEDEILPDRVVSDVVEDEANGEVVEDEQLIDDETAAEIMESIPDAAETETVAEETVTEPSVEEAPIDEAPVTETVEITETVAE